MSFQNRRLVPALIVAAVVLPLAGCVPWGTGQPKTSSSETATTSDPSCCCCEAASGSEVVSKSAEPSETQPAVVLKVVKLKDMLREIDAHRGKLVVVDVWADFCIPCKKEFPHLVKMHRDHARNGLVCVSVCVDEPKDRAAALKFLRKQEATFANYLLDEDTTTWQDHWDLKGIPAVFLYRDGKRIARFDCDDPDNQFTYADVEKTVRRLLAKR